MTRVSFKYWNHRFKDWAAQAKNPALTVPSLWVSSMRKDRTLLDSQKSPALVSFYNFPMLPHSLIICMSAKTKHLSAETSLIVPLVPLSCSRNSILSLMQRAFILDKTFSHGAALRLNLWYCRPITPPRSSERHGDGRGHVYTCIVPSCRSLAHVKSVTGCEVLQRRWAGHWKLSVSFVNPFSAIRRRR